MDRFKKVDLEAHFYTKEYVKALIQNNRYPKIVMEEKTDSYYTWFFKDTCTLFSTTFLEKLLDVNLRLKEMEKFGIEIQILSLATPGIEPLEPNVGVTLARKTNEYLAEIIQKHPEKLNGFATLPTQNPTRALEELEYAVKDLGLVGWATHSNYGKYGYIDDEKYRPILEEAEKLNIPIYIHPTVPAIKQLRAYGFALAGPPFGFTVETAMCAVRLILSGVFDKYPRLKIILGHLGEALPF
ncbi:MAG: amidohydrolase family protein, partial [Candidatus Bathyarchaeia archaeon]